MRRLFPFLARSPDVSFYASSWIDEIWLRSTIAETVRLGFRPNLVLSGTKGAAPPQLRERYAAMKVSLLEAGSIKELHQCRMRHVVTASSGIPRSFFGATLQRLVHMPHSLVSLHMIYPGDAFDGYDTLFASGPHHAREWSLLRRARGLDAGTIRPVGYGKMDVLRAALARTPASAGGPTILVAPSWGETNLLKMMGPALISRMLKNGARIVLRPHPSFFLKDETELGETLAAARGHPCLTVETSTGVEGTAMLGADILVTDYSGTAFEFAALRAKPTVFVNLPKKVLNPDWQSIGSEPVEVALRDQLGIIAEPNVDSVMEAIANALGSPPRDTIAAAIPQFLHDEASVGARAAKEIATLLEDQK